MNAFVNPRRAPGIRTLQKAVLLIAAPLLCSCQQTQLSFEPVAAPTLADFANTGGSANLVIETGLADASSDSQTKPVSGLPPFPQIGAEPLDEKQTETLMRSGIRQQGAVTIDARLNAAHFILVSPGSTLAHGDLLARALNAQARHAALNGDACAENLVVVARLHSLSFSSRCDSAAVLKQRALALMDGLSQMTSADFNRIVREQKLARHIDAFTGADIDRLWAQKVLGEGHPYLGYNRPFDGNLDELSASLQAFRAQAQTHLLSNSAATQDDNAPPSFHAQAEMIDPPQRHAEPDKPALLTPSPQSGKRLYLLDAPGQVQAQVRIGYGLSPSGDSSSCKAAAALLGRSQSGRLFYDLRSQRGLTYGVYGSCIDNPLSRTLKFYGASANESSGAFVRGIVDHLALLAKDDAGTEELNALQSYLAGQRILRADSPDATLADWLDALERGQSQPKAAGTLLDSPALAGFNRLVFSQAPLIVVKGDASVIRADLGAKLPDWQIEVLENIP